MFTNIFSIQPKQLDYHICLIGYCNTYYSNVNIKLVYMSNLSYILQYIFYTHNGYKKDKSLYNYWYNRVIEYF